MERDAWKFMYLSTKKLILLSILLFLLGCAYNEVGVGGGWLHPHSDQEDASLDQGYSVIGTVDQTLYKTPTEWFKFNAELLFIYSRYTKSDRQSRHSEPDSQSDKQTWTTGLCIKPDLKLTDSIHINAFSGIGLDTADSAAPSFIVGSGMDYWFDKNWALGLSMIYMDNHEKTYTLPIVMLRYSF